MGATPLDENSLRRSLEITADAETARIAQSLRRDSPLGEPHNRFFDDVGVVDLVQLRAVLQPRSVECRDISASGRPVRPSSLELLTRPHSPLLELGAGVHRGDEVIRYAVRFAPSQEPLPRFVRIALPVWSWRDRRGHAERPPVEAEVWLDRHGRVRVVSTTTQPLARLPRWLPRVLKEAVKSFEGTGARTVWDTTEVWDFGGPANVEEREPITPTPDNALTLSALRDSARAIRWYLSRWRPGALR